MREGGWCGAQEAGGLTGEACHGPSERFGSGLQGGTQEGRDAVAGGIRSRSSDEVLANEAQ